MKDAARLPAARTDAVDVTGTLRKAQRQIEGRRPKTGLRLLRALEPDELKLPERLRFYYLRALAQLQRQDSARAFGDLDHSAALAQQLRNDELSARTANLIGWAHTQQHRPAMALEFHDRAWQAVEAGVVADPAFGAVVQGNRGHAYLALGNPARAAGAYQDALRRGDGALAPAQLADFAWGLARALVAAGQPQQARLRALLAVGWYESGDHALLLARLRLDYAAILQQLGNTGEAERQLRQAVCDAAGDARLRVAALLALSDLALAAGDTAGAAHEAEAALAGARPLKDPALLGQAWYRVALAAQGTDPTAARDAYRQATGALAAAAQPDLLGQVQVGQARFLAAQGDHAAATAAFEQASGQPAPFPRPALGGPFAPLPFEGFTRTPATNLERRRARAAPNGRGPAARRRPYRIGPEPASVPASAETSGQILAPAGRTRAGR